MNRYDVFVGNAFVETISASDQESALKQAKTCHSLYGDLVTVKPQKRT